MTSARAAERARPPVLEDCSQPPSRKPAFGADDQTRGLLTNAAPAMRAIQFLSNVTLSADRTPSLIAACVLGTRQWRRRGMTKKRGCRSSAASMKNVVPLRISALVATGI